MKAHTSHPSITEAIRNDIPQIPSKSENALEDIGGVIQKWFRSLTHRRYSRRTLQLYTTALKDFSAYLAERQVTRVQDLDLACLEGWREAILRRGFAPASVTSYLGVARNWCRWLSESGMIFINPSARLKVPLAPRPMGLVVSEREVRHFIESISGTDLLSRRDRALAELAYGCGARLGELAQLDVESIDLNRGLVLLSGKGGIQRMVPMTQTAVTSLRHYIGRVRPGLLGQRRAERALFVGLRGTGRLGSDALRRIILFRSAAAGTEILPHTIRRSFATHLVKRGASIAHVKALLGHATYRHLGHYVRLKEALDVDALRKGRKSR